MQSSRTAESIIWFALETPIARRTGESPRACSRAAAPDEGRPCVDRPSPPRASARPARSASSSREARRSGFNARELDFAPQRPFEQAPLRRALVEPVVERAMVLELEGGTAECVTRIDRRRRCRAPVVGWVDGPLLRVRWWCAWRMRYITGSRRLMFLARHVDLGRAAPRARQAASRPSSPAGGRGFPRRRGCGRANGARRSEACPGVPDSLPGSAESHVGAPAPDQPPRRNSLQLVSRNNHEA